MPGQQQKDSRPNPAAARHQPPVRRLLDGVEKKLGMVPNMVVAMAESPAVLQAYLSFSQALSGGLVSARLREQIALAVSQAHLCGYCLAAHTAIGISVGLTDDEVHDARSGTSPDRKTEAVLTFVRRIVDERGSVSDADADVIRRAGYGDAAIAEIIAHVALNTFTNYFNLVAQTEVDFPPVADRVRS